MAVRTKGGQPSQASNQPSAKPGIRFIILLIAVVIVGCWIWGVVAKVQDGKACSLYFSGLELKRNGKHEEAMDNFRDAEKAMIVALDARKKQNSDLDLEVASDIRNLARCQVELGKVTEAQANMKESEALFEKLHAQSNIDYIAVLSEHGDLFLSQQKPEEALPMYEKTLSTLQTTGSKDRLAWMYTHQRLRNAYVKLGKTAEARAADEAAERCKTDTALN